MSQHDQIPQKIEISHKTIIFTVGFLLSLYLLFIIRDVIIGLFISVLIATALNPLINKLEKAKIPRPVGVLIVFSLIISLVVFALATVVPPLISQTNRLIQTLPLEQLSSQFSLPNLNTENISFITSHIGSISPLIKIVTSTFSGLITLFTFMVITSYLILERRNLHKYLVWLFGDHGAEDKAEKFVNVLEKKIGGWVRGQAALMFIVGFVTYIGLRLLNIPFALPLALVAGILELVPNIGPTISAVPAVLVSMLSSDNPLMFVFVIALYILVQQLENNFIVPKVMQSAVGVNPLITILAIIVGFKLAGPAGAILAVPVYIVINVFYVEVVKPRNK